MEAKELGRGNRVYPEAPVQLVSGKNFYDQPPFGLIEDVARQRRLDLNGLRALFTSVVFKKKEFFTKKEYAYPQLHRGHFVEIYKGGVRNWGLNPKEREAYFIAICDAASRLVEFPQIDEYLREQFNKGLYKHDGSWKGTEEGPKNDFILPPSYTGWIADKKARQQRIRLQQVVLGVAEAFTPGTHNIQPKTLLRPNSRKSGGDVS